MTRKRPSARLVPAALLVSVSLLGCSQNAGNPSPPPTADRIDALVLGPVQSDYLEPLKPTLSMVQYDGSQKLENYKMVIFDGDAHTPAAVKANPLVDQALRSGQWVIGVDLTQAHKDSLEPVLHASTCGPSAAYAMRTGYDANGRFQAWVVEPSDVAQTRTSGQSTFGTPAVVEPVSLPAAPPERDCKGPAGVTAQRPETGPGAASAFARTLLAKVAAPARLAPQDGPPTIPTDLIYATYFFAESGSGTVTGGYRRSGTQSPNFTVNRTFTVFNNNKNNPQGDFQFVLLEQDASANPKSPNEGFIEMGTRDGTDWDLSTYDGVGWFQTGMLLTTYPSAPDWSLVASSPDTVNGSTSVTTGTSFNIGFNQSQGATGSFTYSNSQTRNISDWATDNNSTGNQTQWNYRSKNPYNSDEGPAFPSQDLWGFSGYLNALPNSLSQTTFKLYTQSVWRTPTLVDGSVSVNYWGYYGLADLGCAKNGGFFCHSPSWSTAQVYSPWIRQVSFDLGAVVPIPIASVTFSPSPVKGGTTVTGTVTLSAPAKIATSIDLSSNSVNATVLPTVTVKQGQTSATFQVLTNTNNLAPGGSTVATIQAFYAQNFQAQLTVTN